MPKQKTKIILISLTTLTAILVGMSYIIFSHTMEQIASTIDATDQIKSQIKKDEAASFMKKDIIDAAQYQNIIEGYFVQKNSDGDVDLIRILEGLVATSSLQGRPDSVTNEAYPKKTLLPIEEARVRMNLTGEWKNIQYFISLLENYPLKITINQIALDQYTVYQVKGKNIPQWSAAFDISVIKLKN